MKLGYIHFDRTEQKKYLAVISRLSQGGAIDELGVGRIRDLYSDTMFPGVSSLHQHAKYFVVLPLLYRKAATFKYARLSDVRPRIIQLEKDLTERLVRDSEIKTGITGSEFIGGKGYVRYDPTYIYSNGLYRFGILLNDNLEEMIYVASKKYHERPERLQSINDEQGDSEDLYGNLQFCLIPTDTGYDWEKECSLDLTESEAKFLMFHITHSVACKDSLLSYILKNRTSLEDVETFEAFATKYANTLPERLCKTVQNAKYFAELVDGLFYWYNYLYSGNTDINMREKFDGWKNTKFQTNKDRMSESITGLKFNDNGSVTFCQTAIRYIDEGNWDELTKLITARERAIKLSRSKIGNSDYAYSSKSPIHDYTIQFRWETVRTMVQEIYKGLENG